MPTPAAGFFRRFLSLAAALQKSGRKGDNPEMDQRVANTKASLPEYCHFYRKIGIGTFDKNHVIVHTTLWSYDLIKELNEKLYTKDLGGK